MIFRALGTLSGILLVWLLVAIFALHKAQGFTVGHNAIRDNIHRQFNDRRVELNSANIIVRKSAVSLLAISKTARGSQADAQRVKAAINDLYASVNQARTVLKKDSIVSRYKEYVRMKSNNRPLHKDTKLYHYFDNSYHKFVETEGLMAGTFNDLTEFANSVAFKTGVHLSIESEEQSYREFKRVLPEQRGRFYEGWSSLDVIKGQINQLEGLANSHNVFIKLQWGNISTKLVVLDNMLADESYTDPGVQNLKAMIDTDKAKASSINHLQQKLYNYKRRR